MGVEKLGGSLGPGLRVLTLEDIGELIRLAQGATLAGSVLSGILASACCLGPLVLSLLGVSGAAFATRLEPLRPYLLVVTYAFLAGAFYLSHRPGKAQ